MNLRDSSKENLNKLFVENIKSHLIRLGNLKKIIVEKLGYKFDPCKIEKKYKEYIHYISEFKKKFDISLSTEEMTMIRFYVIVISDYRHEDADEIYNKLEIENYKDEST